MQVAGDLAKVDSNEFADLTTLVSNTNFIKMPEDVRNLSQKAILGDPANKAYKGYEFTNLYADAPAIHLDHLSNKWFRGGDLPKPKGQFFYGNEADNYRIAQGSLFNLGVQYSDITQGSLGDCYYLAGLAAVAYRRPQVIQQEMFIDNNDGTFSVRHWNGNTAEYVTVDRSVPVYTSGQFAFAKPGQSAWGNTYANSNNELWVPLAEKAYAQLNESGWLNRSPAENSYQSIEGGLMGTAIKHIARLQDQQYWWFSDPAPAAESIINAFNAGSLVTFASHEDGKPDQLQLPFVGPHAYLMIDYNPSNGVFKLFNPWGVNNGQDGGFVQGNWSYMLENGMSWHINS